MQREYKKEKIERNLEKKEKERLKALEPTEMDLFALHIKQAAIKIETKAVDKLFTDQV